MTLLLSRGEIAALMQPADYLEAVETAFRALGEGRAESPVPLSIHGSGGAFHAKGAALRLDAIHASLKFNANFPGNPQKGMPTVQGAILHCDGATGALLAIMDSIEVTLRRTAAASALAARYLARPESSVVTLIGCGAQASAQLDALRDVLPIATIYCADLDQARAAEFANSYGAEVVSDVPSATLRSDVIVTCTPATSAFLDTDMVRPGTFIAAVGADAPHKSEIAPGLMAKCQLVCDSIEQCLVMGDLHHAIEAESVTADCVHGTLAELATGRKAGRAQAEAITLFDSTGVAVQDVAAAAMIYDRARKAGVGTSIDLAA